MSFDNDAALMEWIENLSGQQRADLEASLSPLFNRLWKPQEGPQTAGYYSQADLMLYGGEAGGGKGLKPETPVLTPFGWKAIGKLKIGSAVCATDGTVTRVIGKFERGKQPVYRLAFSDGSEIVCDADHIWLAWATRKSRKIGNALTCGEDGAKKWATSAIFEHYRKGGARLKIPVISEPVRFNVAGSLKGKDKFIRRTLPPYVLGVLIGDGSLSTGIARFTVPDPEIAERVAKELGCKLGEYGEAGKVISYRIPNAFSLDDLTDLGLLGCRSEDKFIPRIYLLGTVEERFALMQGLMDTDGWAEEDGDVYYCTVSERLRDDVRELARSLGAIVSVREKDPHFTYRGERRQGQTAYTLRIKMPASERVFHLPRKKERVAGKSYQSMGLTLESIEPCGVAETVCIAVEHPNSLFITEHYLVTHNSDLLLGLAVNEHRKSAIFRQKLSDAKSMEERLSEIVGDRGRMNYSDHVWKDGDQRIQFGYLEKPGAEKGHQGQPKDFLGFDEGAQQQAKKQIFLMGWVRSVDPDQRCRVVIASNPPLSGDGDHLIEWFAPWLDPMHPLYPAKPGQLLWAVFVGDEEEMHSVWVDGPEPVEIEGEVRTPKSRTFVPASLADNAYLRDTDYGSQLDQLPEPLRTALKTGNFMMARKDHAWQVIPSEWVRLAQERWSEEHPHLKGRMWAMGVDVAQGGGDKTTLAPLYNECFGRLTTERGIDTKNGPIVASLILKERRDGADIGIDCTGGWGNSARDHLETNNNITAYSVVFSRGTKEKQANGSLGFKNERARLWWRFREALDPNSEHKIALPPSKKLFAELTAVHWMVKSGGSSNEGVIQIEEKDEVRKRLGSSTDEADAVIMAWDLRDAAQYRMIKPLIDDQEEEWNALGDVG